MVLPIVEEESVNMVLIVGLSVGQGLITTDVGADCPVVCIPTTVEVEHEVESVSAPLIFHDELKLEGMLKFTSGNFISIGYNP